MTDYTSDPAEQETRWQNLILTVNAMRPIKAGMALWSAFTASLTFRIGLVLLDSVAGDIG